MTKEELGKEAEEYARNTYEMCSYSGLPYASDRRARELSFKDGAEFGYNKCFEQIQKIVNEHTRLDCIIPELLRLKESK